MNERTRKSSQGEKKSKKRLRRRINLKKKIKIDDEAAYKNGDARDKNSTNTYVKIEVRYRGYKLTTLFHPSLPLPLLFYLPLPSRPSIVSSRYLPTNFAFKEHLEIFLYSARRRSGSVPLKTEIGVVIPSPSSSSPSSNVSKVQRIRRH